MVRQVLPIFAVLLGVGAAHAGDSLSGTWRRWNGTKVESVLRTIDRGGEVEFQLELWNGPPAYNSGLAMGRLSVRDGAATYETTEFGGQCRIEFSFTKRLVVLKQSVGNSADCGFGHGVFAYGKFVRTSRTKPRFALVP